MLSVFPGLLNYPLIGIFILRVALGLVFLKFGLEIFFLKKRWGEKAVNISEIICGAFLLIGFLTQPSALFALLITLTAFLFKIFKRNEIFSRPLIFYFFLAAVSVSLILLGPGAFSIDLPL